jgi:hypothetical protein
MGKKVLAFVAGIFVLFTSGWWLWSRHASPGAPQTPARTMSSTSTPAASATGSSPNRPGAFQRQLYTDIETNGLTPERAKQLFSLAIGPLPGVTVPDNARDPDDFCATRAVSDIFQVWNTLSADQQAAVRRLLNMDRWTTTPSRSLASSLIGFATPHLERVSYTSFRPARRRACSITRNTWTTPISRSPVITERLRCHGFDVARTSSGTGWPRPRRLSGTITGASVPDVCHIHI